MLYNHCTGLTKYTPLKVSIIMSNDYNAESI